MASDAEKVVNRLKKLSPQDVMIFLDFVCIIDSTGIPGIQMAMIKLLAARLDQESKEFLAERQKKHKDIILGTAPVATYEHLLCMNYQAVDATIQQIVAAKQIELGRRSSVSRMCKPQTFARFLLFKDLDLNWALKYQQRVAAQTQSNFAY